MKCYGTCQFLRGLWMDLSAEAAALFMRTDANNLVTTAATTHVPTQKETIHMIQMLRKEACSGSIDDLAHVRTEYCLSDCFTKHSAKADNLIQAVETGVLPMVDCAPAFRTTMPHKAYVASASAVRDYWEVRDALLVRVHVRPRRALFSPHISADCPVALSRIVPSRCTYIFDSHGDTSERKDSWLGRNSTTRSSTLWTGETVFQFI
jgi:hypothetical protein